MIESFDGLISIDTTRHSYLREVLLDWEIFYSLNEAKMPIEMWRNHYNTVRRHSSLGSRPPAPVRITAGPPSAALRSTQQRKNVELLEQEMV